MENLQSTKNYPLPPPHLPRDSGSCLRQHQARKITRTWSTCPVSPSITADFRMRCSLTIIQRAVENAKRPTKLWAERCSRSEPQARLATPSSSQTVLVSIFPLAVTGTTISIYPQLDELGSIEAHLQPSYRTAIVSVDFLEV